MVNNQLEVLVGVACKSIFINVLYAVWSMFIAALPPTKRDKIGQIERFNRIRVTSNVTYGVTKVMF